MGLFKKAKHAFKKVTHSVSSIFHQKKAKPPVIFQEPAPPLPTESPEGKAAIEAAEKREAERLRKMKGRKATILTGDLGEATVGKKKLLGA